MGRVKFKHPRGGDLQVRRKLLEILAGKVKVYRLIPARDGVVVITNSDGDADTIFSEEVEGPLRAEGFTAIIPPELRCQRSVVCFGLDDIAYLNEPEEIKAELEAHHPWLKIIEIYKFPKTNTIKITCASSGIAKKAAEAGLLMFSLSVPPGQMRVEIYTPLMACDRCHAVENHTTSQCPEPADRKICSECASTEHTFRECGSETKFCVNCKEHGHSARAMRCPIRKKLHKEKQKNNRVARDSGSTLSYAAAAQQGCGTQQAATLAAVAPSKPMSPVLCLLNAHMINAVRPGSFQKALTNNLTMNGLEDVKLPPDQPSAEIVNFFLAGNGLSHGVASTVATPPPTSQAASVATQESTTPPPTPLVASEATRVVTHESSPARRASPAPSDHSGNNSSRPASPVPSFQGETEGEDMGEEEEEIEIEEQEEKITFNSKEFRYRIAYRAKDKLHDRLSFKTLKKGLREERFKLWHNGKDERDSERLLNILEKKDPLIKYCEPVTDEVFDKIGNGQLDLDFAPLPDDEPRRYNRTRARPDKN